MGFQFVSCADYGLDRSTEVFARGYSDYFVKLALTPAVLLNMVRVDSVDLAASRVALRAGVAVGAAAIARRGWSCRLAGMAVAPEARRIGAGRALLDLVLAEAKARGEREMSLEVIQDNAAALALYENAGFRRVRALVGCEGPAQKGAPPDDSLREVDLRAMAAAVAQHGLGDLPWQVSAETLAQLGPPSVAYRLGAAWLALTPAPAGDTVAVRGFATERNARRQGAMKTLIRAAMARNPATTWRFSAVFPEEIIGAFEAAGLKRGAMKQWQMARVI
jgi:GNAT superfamily N-acetyltransferase